jgi:hypothetical protein
MVLPPVGAFFRQAVAIGKPKFWTCTPHAPLRPRARPPASRRESPRSTGRISKMTPPARAADGYINSTCRTSAAVPRMAPTRPGYSGRNSAWPLCVVCSPQHATRICGMAGGEASRAGPRGWRGCAADDGGGRAPGRRRSECNKDNAPQGCSTPIETFHINCCCFGRISEVFSP